jgi:hypothetical protein
LLPNSAETNAVIPILPVNDPIAGGLLGEQCLVTDAVSLLPGPPQAWVTVGASEVTAKLNWSVIYPQLETVAEGAIVMVPTTKSGWIKIVKGPSPTTSAFYIQADKFYMEPGSTAEIIGRGSAPQDSLERVHLALDVIGLAPAIGAPADAVNGVLYFIEGDTFNGTLSMAAIVPIGGEAATLSKWGVKYGDELVDFGSRNFLRRAMNLTHGVEAHHVVPWELRYHEIVQAAGRAGFDLNDPINGFSLTRLQLTKMPLEFDLAQAGQAALDKVVYIEIPSGVHANHPAYNFYIVKWLETFTEKLGGIDNIDPLVARELLENTIIPTLDEDLALCISRDLNVNSFFKDKLIQMKWFDTYKDYASSSTFYSFIHGTNELLSELSFMKR